MKKIFIALSAMLLCSLTMAQNTVSKEEMMKEWRQMKHMRDYSKEYTKSNIPQQNTITQSKGVQALPEDRVWFPGEWEEVKAIVVTPSYSYEPDTNLGSGYYMADPVVTGYAEYYKYNVMTGWNSTGIYGPYRSVMDTNTSFGRVFFYLMDGIQKGHAEAWVRVEKAEDSAKVLRTLSRMNLRRDNVRFLVGPGNSFWYRDCGPICFYHGDEDSVAMLDFEYYPGRALDDSLPSIIYRQMGIPNYINSIEWEGGNCLVDGAGFLLSSDALYSNNADTYGQLTWNGRDIRSLTYSTKPSLSRSQTFETLRSLLGQRETHILPAYRYDGGTGHIDLYADMCEENGFVFSIMPERYRSWRDYTTGARNIDSLCSYTSIFDREYYKTSIPFPSKDNGSYFTSQTEYNEQYTRTYSNHTFVNDLILQPCFSTVVNGHPTAEWDRANIDALQAAYPGYTIYPVDVHDFDGSGGAIHCVTKQIPADNPVRILHKSIVGNASAMRGSDVPVSAVITNKSGIAKAKCIYRINGGDWDTITLNANGNKFSATIPTAAINERVIDTDYVPMTTVDSTYLHTDTVVTISRTFVYIDSITLDSVFTTDTAYSYIPVFSYDTIDWTDTVTSVRDTLVTVQYYISASSRNGKTITKPMTAHQGGYYSFYYDGAEMDLDSNDYDFSTEPMPATDITFLFDAVHTHADTSTEHTVSIEEPIAEQAFGQFYPNPASDRANIKINLGNGGNYAVTIYDAAGRTIHTSTLQAAGNVVYTLRADRMQAGIYTVTFRQGNQTISRRLVVR